MFDPFRVKTFSFAGIPWVSLRSPTLLNYVLRDPEPDGNLKLNQYQKHQSVAKAG